MKNPSIISGLQSEGDRIYPYVGLALGKYEYRIYRDREGWFVDGEYTAVPPTAYAANRILKSVRLAGKQTFVAFMDNNLEKWKLKEMAGV